MMNQSPDNLITRPTQVAALASAVRQEIVDTIDSEGPMTAAELASLLGRSADGLYFHMKRLVRVGLLKELEPRREGRHVAAVYDLVHRPPKLSYASPVPAKGLSAVIASAARLATREFAAGVRVHASRAGAKERPLDLWGARSRGWLTTEQLGRVNELLGEAMGIVRAGKRGGDAAAVSLTFVLAPAKKGRDRSKNKGGVR